MKLLVKFPFEQSIFLIFYTEHREKQDVCRLQNYRETNDKDTDYV